MQRKIFPIKLYILLAIALQGAELSCLSRYATDLPIREKFKIIGFGNASLIEHLLAGFAAPAIAVALVLLLMPVTKTRFIKTRFRVLALVKFRRWLMSRMRPTYITHFTAIIACAYVMVSLQWEASQMEIRGFFQFDQFGMDLAGAFAFCVSMWALLEKNRQLAKAQRSFSLV